jgi:trans-2,3-dihydro-3-hydroxyanthranilate isomerase
MSHAYLHYDVFTGTPLLGNQLAVFTDGAGLSTGQMQAMTREMNFAESTFILPAEAAGTDIRMRIFTPHLEMPMAGHPTIGSTFALADTGVIRPGTRGFVFGLYIGPVPDDLVPDLPVQVVSCGVPYVLAVLRDQETVDRAACDAGAFRRLCAAYSAETAVFLFALVEADAGAGAGAAAGAALRRPDDTGGPDTRPTVYSRMFAPAHGVVEDPATGSASGPLGCYVVRHRLVTPDAQRHIVSSQGVAMGRASTIYVAIEGTPDEITQVKVGGQAVLVGRGELLVS